MNKQKQSGVLQNEWVLREMGVVRRKNVLRFLVGKYLQIWRGDFAHMGVAQ
jgi:hypothetical protein